MSYSDHKPTDSVMALTPSIIDTLKPNPTTPRRRPKSSTLLLILITTIFSLVLIHLRLNPSTQFSPAGLSNLIIHQYFNYHHPSDQSQPTNANLEDSLRLRLSKSTGGNDYNKYVWHKEILSDWDPSSNHRLIVLGDIHGMVESLRYLLVSLNYDSASDTILLVGDLVAKHPSIRSSLKTIRYCRESNFEVIRGNHDQYVIIWRNWMEDNRKKFVQANEIEAYRSSDQATLESDAWLQGLQPPKELKKKLPEGMKWKTQHFEIARRLPKVDFHWLLDRTLTIYIPPLHTYFVHAGMLPWTPPNEAMASSSPQSVQKQSLLTLKENQDPYTLLEMRGLRKGRKPTRDGRKGKPWYKYWNKTMKSCNGTAEDEIQWCRETYQIVYGHWAGKGLTIKPWSIGLDSGCVYGRRLSALVVGGKDRATDQGQQLKAIPVDIRGHEATVFSTSCPKP